MLQRLYEREEIDYGLTDGYKQALFLQTDQELQKLDIDSILYTERAIRTAVVGLGHLIDSGQAVGFALDTARGFVAERGERRTKIYDR